MNELRRLREAFERGDLDKHAFSRAMAAHHVALGDYAALLAVSEIESVEARVDGVWLRSRLAPVSFACAADDRGCPPMVALNFGGYETEELSLCRALLPRGGVFVDVGANIGWYAAHLAALDRSARVYAFEPVPTSRGFLARTVARNGLDNVTVEPMAVSDREGELTLYVDETIAGAASEHPTAYAQSSSAVRARSTTLDAYFAGGAARLDLVKLDVEGGELAALRGARSVIARDRPAVFCEMLRRHARAFGYHPNDIIALMSAEGYACFRVSGGRLRAFAAMDDDTVETNFFFLHAEAHAYALESLSR